MDVLLPLVWCGRDQWPRLLAAAQVIRSLHHLWRRKPKEIPSRTSLTSIGKTNFPFNWVMSFRLLPFVPSLLISRRTLPGEFALLLENRTKEIFLVLLRIVCWDRETFQASLTLCGAFYNEINCTKERSRYTIFSWMHIRHCSRFSVLCAGIVELKFEFLNLITREFIS